MLSPDQVKAREGRLTASRVGVLMRGDPGPIHTLWLEMTDSPEYQPEDLSGVWAVQLGVATEPLNIEWFTRKYGPVSRQGEVVIAFDPEWAACTLDGWAETQKVPIECKHVGGREPYEVVLERYQPQLQWIAHVCDAREVAFSVIAGANEPIVEFIPRDIAYIEQHLLPRATLFMQHVRNRTLPVDMPAVPNPGLVKKVYDMSNHVEWRTHAQVWMQCWPAAESAKNAEKILKALVPSDAKMAFGCGCRISRDRAGRLSLREDA